MLVGSINSSGSAARFGSVSTRPFRSPSSISGAPRFRTCPRSRSSTSSSAQTGGTGPQSSRRSRASGISIGKATRTPTASSWWRGWPPLGPRRTHQVHICEVGGSLWERLRFRDYLRHHAEDRLAYADLKHRLAAAHPDDREAYTRGKDAFVAAIMERARSWGGV